MLASATVQITDNYASAEDVLKFVNTPSITHNFNPANGMLTLSGVDTLANYQAALRSVTYENTSQNPSTLIRTVSFRGNDAFAFSAGISRQIQINPVNEIPTLSNIETAALIYTEDSAGVPLTSTLTVADLDNSMLASATVQITVNYASAEDV